MFQVPVSQASHKQNRFEFQVPGSKKVWSLPLLKFLSADKSEKLQRAGAAARQYAEGEVPAEVLAQVSALQREIIEEHCPGLYERVDTEQLAELVKAWQEASGVTLGESASSPQS